MENAKIRVVICSGTTCYVMGGADLLGLEQALPADLIGRVDIEGSPCLDLCKGGMYGKAPFVRVNKVTVSEATIPRVIEEIRKQSSMSLSV